jgi:tripartite-type tricarboxylate transporter receptor subunit TctC
MRSSCLCAILAVVLASGAMAEDAAYPARPIQVVVPATPGGPVDTAIRMIEPRLSAALGTPLVLLNRPGASGIVGMASVATAAPDGYTIGQGINSASRSCAHRDRPFPMSSTASR